MSEKKKLSKADKRALRAQKRAVHKQQPNPVQPTTTQKTTPTKTPPQKTPPQQTQVQQQTAPKKQKKQKKQEEKITIVNDIFSHLEKYQKHTDTTILNPSIHPSIIQLGNLYKNGTIVGSNARAVGLLKTISKMVIDYKAPEKEVFKVEFGKYLNENFDYLSKNRQLGISMRHAIKHVKNFVHNLEINISEIDSKKEILKTVDKFLNEKIIYSIRQIVTLGVNRINDDDVILTYARSEVIEQILIQAKKEKKKFSVIIVNSRPKNEGKLLLKRLVEEGIDCSFVLISGVSYVMKDVNKVMLGAHSLLSNGNLVSRAGTAIVASVAKHFNVPVLVCCETYKFSESPRLDSITKNELGDPEELIRTPTLGDGEDNNGEIKNKVKEWEKDENINVLNILYDVTPNKFIGMVISELGYIPSTSVPVVLREYNKDLLL